MGSQYHGLSCYNTGITVRDPLIYFSHLLIRDPSRPSQCPHATVQRVQGGLDYYCKVPGVADLYVTAVGIEEQVGVANEQRRSRGMRDSWRRASGRCRDGRQQHQQRNIVLQPEAAHLQRLALQRREPPPPPECEAAVAAVPRACRVCRFVPVVFR